MQYALSALLEAVIRMFDPNYDMRRIAVRRRNRTNGPFKRVTRFRAALDVLRGDLKIVETADIDRRLRELESKSAVQK
jgi:hypothetical protein